MNKIRQKNKEQTKAYMKSHDLISSLQKAFTGVGRVQPQEPLIWLQEFFVSRHGSKKGSLAADWVQVRAPNNSVYWVDLVSGGVEIDKPAEAGLTDDIWEQSDATAMQAVMRDLRRGNMKHEDASEWVRRKFMKKVRVMNCVLRRGSHEEPCWGGTLREADAGTLKELEQFICKVHGVDQDLLKEVSKAKVTSIQMLKRVFVSFAESSADKVDEASISRQRFLELLEDFELCHSDESSNAPFSLDSTLGEKFLRNGHELTKKDAETIYDLVVAGVQGPNGGPMLNDVNPEMSFSGFLVSLHMISKRTRRPLNDVLADITFSQISAAHRPAFAAMSNKGVMRRVKGVFKRFTGGKQTINGKQWRRLCQDCDIVNKFWGFSANDADAVFAAASARSNKGSTSGKGMDIKDAEKLLNMVAARIGCLTEDIVGLVAWSFGPKVEAAE